jgi:hypothetical protein
MINLIFFLWFPRLFIIFATIGAGIQFFDSGDRFLGVFYISSAILCLITRRIFILGLLVLLIGAAVVSQLYDSEHGLSFGIIFVGIICLFIAIPFLFYGTIQRWWLQIKQTPFGKNLVLVNTPDSQLSVADRELRRSKRKATFTLFGRVFRPLFMIGIIGNYVYFVTLSRISGAPFETIIGFGGAIVLTVVCAIWFLRFPDNEVNYERWGIFAYSSLLIFLVGMIAYIVLSN